MERISLFSFPPFSFQHRLSLLPFPNLRLWLPLPSPGRRQAGMSSPKDRGSLFPHHGLPFEEAPPHLTAQSPHGYRAERPRFPHLGTTLHPPSPDPALCPAQVSPAVPHWWLLLHSAHRPKQPLLHTEDFFLSCSCGLFKVPSRPLISPLAVEPHKGTMLLGKVSQLLGFPQICRMLGNAPGSPAVPQEVIVENLKKR